VRVGVLSVAVAVATLRIAGVRGFCVVVVGLLLRRRERLQPAHDAQQPIGLFERKGAAELARREEVGDVRGGVAADASGGRGRW